ncbi:MAG TPA: hypothetical protein VGN34_04885 [Ktedonobacteraceae bacterium]|jgi:hypothetical protein
MQGTICSTTASMRWCSITPSSTLSVRDYRYLVYAQRALLGDGPAIPGSPGRARRLRPYPPSRYKQQ